VQWGAGGRGASGRGCAKAVWAEGEGLVIVRQQKGDVLEASRSSRIHDPGAKVRSERRRVSLGKDIKQAVDLDVKRVRHVPETMPVQVAGHRRTFVPS